MSVAMLTRVWKHSGQKSGALLVLLAIADYADDNGIAFPSIQALQAKSRLSERSVQASLQRLIAADELVIEAQAGPHRCNRYRIVLHPDPADSAPCRNCTPQKTTPEGAAGCTQTVINRHSINTVAAAAAPVARARARGDTGFQPLGRFLDSARRQQQRQDLDTLPDEVRERLARPPVGEATPC
jgi:Helix-turn-helix domain